MPKRIINTCNFGRDYPNETFLPIPALSEEDAKKVAEIINKAAGPIAMRYWRVVDLDYKLQPGFEP